MDKTGATLSPSILISFGLHLQPQHQAGQGERENLEETVRQTGYGE